MRSRLVKMSWIAAAAVVIGIADAAPARADELVVATVPFEFIVGHARLPAGKYTVSTTSEDRGVLAVTSSDGTHTAFVLAIATPVDETAARPGLVFSRFSGEYFLSRIVTPNDEGQEVPLSPEIMQRELSELSLGQ